MKGKMKDERWKMKDERWRMKDKKDKEWRISSCLNDFEEGWMDICDCRVAFATENPQNKILKIPRGLNFGKIMIYFKERESFNE